MKDKLQFLNDQYENLRKNPFAATSASKLYISSFVFYKNRQPTLLQLADQNLKRNSNLETAKTYKTSMNSEEVLEHVSFNYKT